MMDRRDFLKAVVALTGLAASPLVVKGLGEDTVSINGERYVFTRTRDEEGARWHRVADPIIRGEPYRFSRWRGR